MGLTPAEIAKLSPSVQAQIKSAQGKSPSKKVQIPDLKTQPATDNIYTGIQVINGKCPSKSNCYTIIKLKGYSSLGKTKSLTEYEKSFYLQCNLYRNSNITGLFELELSVFNESNRADLDNSLKIILDCLQKVNAIKNDNNCIKIVAQKFIDKDRPRIEFKLIRI